MEKDIKRVNVGETYFTVTPYGDIVTKTEEGSIEDNWLFEWGNYFNEESQAYSTQKELINAWMFV